MVVPELINGEVEENYDGDEDDAEGIQDEVCRGEFVVTSYCKVLCLIDAIVVELVVYSIDEGPIISHLPLIHGIAVGLPSIAVELIVVKGVVITILVTLGNIISLV